MWVAIVVGIQSVIAKHLVWQTNWVYAMIIATVVHVAFDAIFGFYFIGSIVWIVTTVVVYLKLHRMNPHRG